MAENNKVNKSNHTVNNKKITKDNNKKKNILIIGIVIFTVVTSVLIFLYTVRNKKMDNEKLSYNEQMQIIGFSNYYNDDSEYVKRIEALKIILCVTTNTKDAYKYLYSTKEDEDQRWIDCAYDSKMAPKNYFENKDENISLVDVLELLGMAKENILQEQINDVEDVKLKDYNEYLDYYQKYIKDMIANGIIENKEENLDGFKDITKAQFNELVIKFMLKYSTLVDKNEKIDYKNSLKLTKDKGYPFVLEGMDNKSYAKKYEVKNSDNFLSPNDVYKKFGRVYYSTCEDYLKSITNIDYETIDENKFYLNVFYFCPYSKEYVDEYIKFVKENKIKISSDTKIVKPIIYFDGENYRLRVQIKYEIQNSDTDKNLFLFDDKSSNTKYNKKDTIYLDFKVNINENGFVNKFI